MSDELIRFNFGLLLKDVERFFNILDSLISKLDIQLSIIATADSLDPGVDMKHSNSSSELLKSNKTFLIGIRDTILSSLTANENSTAIINSIADTVIEQSQFYDILKRNFLELELYNLLESDQASTVDISDSTLYKFIDGSFLIVNDSRVCYNGAWHKCP